MAYLDLQTEFITEQTLEQLAQRSNVNFLSPGAKVRLTLDIINDKLGIQARQFDVNTGQAFIRNANGQLLDFIGEVFGITRKAAKKPEVSKEEKNFYFYTLENTFGAINLNSDIVIPAGAVKIYNTDSPGAQVVTYINTSVIVLPAGEQRVYFSAESEGLGSAANVGINSLNKHNFKGYSDSLNTTLAVTNESSITYGEDTESDDNFRFRIQQQAIAGESANASAIRLSLLSVPGVSDVVRIKYPRGIGTTDWLIKAVTPSVPSRLITICQNSIGETEAEGMENLAKAPVIVGLQLIFSMTYRSRLEEGIKTQIKTEVRKNIINYVNNLGIGERLVIDQVKKIILNSDSRIESLGDENSVSDFNKVNLYKRSDASDSVVRRTLVDTYRTKPNERVIVETSIASPIVITDNN